MPPKNEVLQSGQLGTRRSAGLMAYISQVVGPGILFASCAIGVSHLVQSTRAGALFGFDMLLVIILANVLKFPFFEYGSRYACATGHSILWGYRKQGKWALYLYFGLSLISMFSVAAAVTFVCAGLFGQLFGLPAGSAPYVAGGILLFCTVILAAGKFGLLDNALKVLAIVLTLTTVFATVVLLLDWGSGAMPSRSLNTESTEVFSLTSLPFLIALMGWMPTAVDLSAWNSLWTVEKIRQTGYHPSLKETLSEFNIGYWLSAGLALCFLTLGALLMYGQNVELSESSVGFAGQLISLYTQAVGSWIYYIIAVAAATVMLSTVITVLDGYSRAMQETIRLLSNQQNRPRQKGESLYQYLLVGIALGSAVIIFFLTANLTTLVDYATILSFIIAPVIAVLNYKVIRSPEVKKTYQPKWGMRLLTWLGIIYLSGFTVLYLYYLLVIQ
jgi:Mn2+/Fe2+ NRAMP family transporter